MLDTNTLDYIVNCNCLFEKVISAIKSGEITLFITHIQVDEINAIPDVKAELRLKLQYFIQNYCNRVPTVGLICGISAIGECMLSDGKDIMAITNNSRQIGKDALIAATANRGFDYFVTNDDKLRTRILKELPDLAVLKHNEFQEYFLKNDNKIFYK
ncbi:MAG: hypothetical protein Q7T80_13895 [Methanoregula sp.]|nr:hypothetical protein [Methanoregula sp.]